MNSRHLFSSSVYCLAVMNHFFLQNETLRRDDIGGPPDPRMKRQRAKFSVNHRATWQNVGPALRHGNKPVGQRGLDRGLWAMAQWLVLQANRKERNGVV